MISSMCVPQLLTLGGSRPVSRVICKVCIWAKWPIRPELIPVSVFLIPLDGMLVHHRVNLDTWVEREVLWNRSVLSKNTTQCPQPPQGSSLPRLLDSESRGPPQPSLASKAFHKWTHDRNNWPKDTNTLKRLSTMTSRSISMSVSFASGLLRAAQ